MKENRYTEKLIDRFLQDKLSPEETEQFNSLLDTDDTFREQLDIMRHIMISFEKKGEHKALAEIKNLSSKEEFADIIRKAEQKNRYSSFKKPLYITAVAVACIALIFIYIGMQPKYSTEYLFDEYYTEAVYENVSVRGGTLLSENQQKIKEKATGLYKQQAYSQALDLYNSLKTEVNSDALPEDVLFYSAICLIERGEYNTAIGILKPLFEEGLYFNESAGWYLALTYLKENKRDKTTLVLEELVVNKSEYQNISQDLLMKINNKKWFN